MSFFPGRPVTAGASYFCTGPLFSLLPKRRPRYVAGGLRYAGGSQDPPPPFKGPLPQSLHLLPFQPTCVHATPCCTSSIGGARHRLGIALLFISPFSFILPFSFPISVFFFRGTTKIKHEQSSTSVPNPSYQKAWWLDRMMTR